MDHQYKEIIHEVVHFLKGHKDTSDPKKYKEQEKEAKKQAKKWLFEGLRNIEKGKH